MSCSRTGGARILPNLRDPLKTNKNIKVCCILEVFRTYAEDGGAAKRSDSNWKPGLLSALFHPGPFLPSVQCFGSTSIRNATTLGFALCTLISTSLLLISKINISFSNYQQKHYIDADIISDYQKLSKLILFATLLYLFHEKFSNL